ncbi:MAG: C4-dicarboxylate ABC transporter [Hydrogenophilales bacterium CG_4_9_14_3_um_filter_63_34]|nr:MAG: C4-dicarboxylate ABC transporter [Hydrogenophilales bacterium CG_4_10_14_3_um_filter_63_21]PJB02906.1 MAG: C4-dicarboxylate ABC transporter [Hydrogenophilales bacterium CG_4_9_14_3_um_filter_63_34]
MGGLLSLARLIDALNERVGRAAMWLVLAATLISSGNAIMRYGFDRSSNAWLEIQWYLFALIFLLGAGYTLKHNGHVRIDILYGRFSPRLQAWVDLVGGLLFLLPLCGLMIWMGWDGFAASWAVNETSPDAGGLSRWPIKLAIPLGFALLWLQGVAEVIKRAAFLSGHASLVQERAEEVV